jgi:hypothetical protein
MSAAVQARTRSRVGQAAYRLTMTVVAFVLGLLTFYGATFVHSLWFLEQITPWVD